jgi:hypothetical protein
MPRSSRRTPSAPVSIAAALALVLVNTAPASSACDTKRSTSCCADDAEPRAASCCGDTRGRLEASPTSTPRELTVLLPDRGAVAVRLQISFAPPAGPARACTRGHRPATVLRI